MGVRTGAVSAAERAYAHIRDAIMRGELAAGTMLSENELAAALSMSRTPVRAALVRLQHEGWVRIYARRGALVRGLSHEEVRQYAQVRHALETEGVHRATEPARRGLSEQLLGNLEQQERALSAGDFAAFAPLALRFHRAFVELAANQLMLDLYDRLQDRQQLSINQSAGRITGEVELVLSEHRSLLDAARDGDWVGFGSRLTEHQDRSHGSEDGTHVP